MAAGLRAARGSAARVIHAIAHGVPHDDAHTAAPRDARSAPRDARFTHRDAGCDLHA